MWSVEHSVQKVVFGCPLQEHLRHAGADISVVIEQCVMALLKHGLNEEVALVHCFLLSIAQTPFVQLVVDLPYNLLWQNPQQIKSSTRRLGGVVASVLDS